jgi:hypothetical protein
VCRLLLQQLFHLLKSRSHGRFFPGDEAHEPRQRSSKAERVAIKYNANRELPTQTVLDLLKAQLPRQYELAEIVGKWIWLEFPAASHRAATSVLMRLGFHWNQRRGVWQHPCKACAPFAAHPQDPRAKYGSYFAADLKPI